MSEAPLVVDDLCIKIDVEQRLVLELFDQIKAGMHVYTSVKPLLRKLHDHLLEHLHLQNKIVDEILVNFIKDKKIEQKQFEFLQIDLKDVKIQTLIFLEEHPADLGEVNPKNFIGDFQNYVSRIIERFQVENEFLLPILRKEYDK